MNRILLILFTLASCAQNPVGRTPASTAISQSCINMHQSIIRRVNNSFEEYTFNGLSDMPQNIVDVSESFDEQGIDYRYIKKIEDGLLGIEILPNQHSVINRYVKNIANRFDGVRVFYIDNPESKSLGSFTPSKNYIYISKDISTNLSERGFTTLSHEARHAYFTSKMIRYMEGSYKGKITAVKGKIKGSGNFSYTDYMSFEEIKTFREDSRKFLNLWSNKVIQERKNNKVFWDRFTYKKNAALSYIQSTRHYLTELMNGALADNLKFEYQLGVINASKEVIEDSENAAIVRVALNKHFSQAEVLDLSKRDELLTGTIDQINKELDQLFIDESIIASQSAFIDGLEGLKTFDRYAFYTLFFNRNTLINARELRSTKIQGIVNNFSRSTLRSITNGAQEISDADAIKYFAQLIKESTVTKVDQGYLLSFRNGQLEISINETGEVLQVSTGY